MRKADLLQRPGWSFERRRRVPQGMLQVLALWITSKSSHLLQQSG